MGSRNSDAAVLSLGLLICVCICQGQGRGRNILICFHCTWACDCVCACVLSYFIWSCKEALLWTGAKARKQEELPSPHKCISILALPSCHKLALAIRNFAFANAPVITHGQWKDHKNMKQNAILWIHIPSIYFKLASIMRYGSSVNSYMCLTLSSTHLLLSDYMFHSLCWCVILNGCLGICMRRLELFYQNPFILF